MFHLNELNADEEGKTNNKQTNINCNEIRFRISIAIWLVNVAAWYVCVCVCVSALVCICTRITSFIIYVVGWIEIRSQVSNRMNIMYGIDLEYFNKTRSMSQKNFTHDNFGFICPHTKPLSIFMHCLTIELCTPRCCSIIRIVCGWNCSNWSRCVERCQLIIKYNKSYNNCM